MMMRSQRGLSLIELMISLAIGLGLLAALTIGASVRLLATRIQPRRNHAAVVQNKQVAFAQHLGKISKHAVGVFARLAIESQHTRAGALRRRLLRDQFRG